MDGLGVESCSSSRSSPSLRGLNLICSGNNTERRPSDSSNSSEASISPTPSSTDSNRRPSVNEGSRDETYWEKRRRNNDAAKRSREKRRINDMIMEQKLLELTKENNLLRSRLKQQQEQQQQQQQQEQQQTSCLIPAMPHDTVIVSTAQKTDTIAPVVPAVPSLPVSSVTTLASNLANVVGPPSKLPAMFPTHLFAATPLLTAPPPGSSSTPLLAPPGTAAAAPLLTPAGAVPPVAVSATAQQLPMLQICTIQAALQQAQQNYCSPSGPTIISSGHGAFQPFHSSRDPTSSTQSYSPDSSTTDAAPVDYSMHGTAHTESSSDPRHFLRYRLLERQTDVASETGQHGNWNDRLTTSMSSSGKAKEIDPDEKPRSLLGSLLSKRTSPLVAQSRTDTHSGLNSTPPKDNDLKNCLSSLAVNLSTAVAASATTAATAVGASSVIGVSGTSGNTTKSESSDSMESPTSNNSTTDSMRSQISPAPKNSAIVKALRSRPSSKQQYMDRRRRNNEAAKRCRANRRAQFEYRSKRAQQLEAENDELRREMNRLKQELEQLKALHAAKTAAVLQSRKRTKAYVSSGSANASHQSGSGFGRIAGPPNLNQ